MHKLEQLETSLRENNITLVGPVVAHLEKELTHYAFVKADRSKGGRRNPSARRLKALAESIEKLGYKLVFVVVEDDVEVHSVGLKSLIRDRLGDNTRGVYLARSGKTWDVWIDFQGEVDESMRKVLSEVTDKYMELYRLAMRRIVFVGTNEVPTVTAVLGVLRVLAPANARDLSVALEKRGFLVPDDAWLTRTLDRVRKAGLVVRRRDGKYFLSAIGLSRMGSRRDRKSPDVRRALALSRQLT